MELNVIQENIITDLIISALSSLTGVQMIRLKLDIICLINTPEI